MKITKSYMDEVMSCASKSKKSKDMKESKEKSKDSGKKFPPKKKS